MGNKSKIFVTAWVLSAVVVPLLVQPMAFKVNSAVKSPAKVMYIHDATNAKVAGYSPASVTGLGVDSNSLHPPGAPHAKIVAVTPSVARIQVVGVLRLFSSSSSSCTTQTLPLSLPELAVLVVVLHNRGTRPVA